jgi:hypothetical protein
LDLHDLPLNLLVAAYYQWGAVLVRAQSAVQQQQAWQLQALLVEMMQGLPEQEQRY